MAEKYLYNNSGQITEKEAKTTSAGAADAGKIPALGSDGRFDVTMMPNGFGDDAQTITASENLSAGDIINIHDASGAKARRADASNGRAAKGFILAAVLSGQPARVFFEGIITGLSGLTPGANYYLSATTAGAITATAPTGSGQIVQPIGYAITATELSFEAGQTIVLA